MGDRSHGFTHGDPDEEIRVGVSSCLLGQEVRYDGGHKRDRFVIETLGEFFRFVPVCPEVDIGLGVPRETIRLVKRDGEIRLVAPKSGADHTPAMTEYARKKVAELERLDLSGYLLKRASPSCGMERVRVHDDESAVAERSGRGIFAAVLMEQCPLLPVEEEGRLHDPRLRENFFDRVFGYHRLCGLFRNEWSVGDLVAFHTAEKYLLLSHEPEGYTELGRMVAEAKKQDRAELAARYRERFMRALTVQATPARHVNVLEHMIGYFRDVLGTEERRELRAAVEDYREGYVPLVVPVTLIRHYVRIHEVGYLQGQRYLEPHPKELKIRNHV